MDSTFLKTDKTYNKPRFLKQYAELKKRGIHFVAASGNPLYTLKQYFPEIGNEIAYVAENGVYVMDGDTEINYSAFQPEFLKQIIADLHPDFAECMLLCAKHCGYMGPEIPEQSLAKLNIYFKKLQGVNLLLKMNTANNYIVLVISFTNSKTSSNCSFRFKCELSISIASSAITKGESSR